jgi:Serine/threonine protein kinase
VERKKELMQRYEIQKILGQGGNAKVYLVCERASKRKRALKEITKSQDGLSQDLAHREAELIRKLKYPYFPEILEVSETTEAVYIVMEYLEGETLGARLRRMGPQPCEEVLCWGKDLCLMLDYLHRRHPAVIYCDLKPDNVMVQSGENLRLIDFGAVLEIQEDQKDTGPLFGTRGYAAPEQFIRGQTVDARTDIYGLGVTLYQLLTNKDPCEFPCKEYSIRDWNRSLPRRLDKIIQKCTKENPKERYPSCEKLRQELCSLM